MNLKTLLTCSLAVFTSLSAYSQTGSIKGTITSQGRSLSYIGVSIPRLNAGVLTDSTGVYMLNSLNAGTHKLKVSGVGFSPRLFTVNIAAGDTTIADFELTSADNTLDAVVVTGTRTARRRLSSPVAVNILDSKTFNITQSNTLSEGLCFQPGLRMETDCQTCNYTQLRMNGMGGAYSQMLVNSRPVFSSLMSLYGLEQIPANMIDRVEVIRGGGSVLYGSSAIAGTVNIITKQPRSSSFTLSNNTSLIDGKRSDNFLNANLNVVNDNQNAGLSFFASRRDRQDYDANGDGFSEMPLLRTNSFGFNSFLQFDPYNKLEINGWSIYEERRGGNKISDQPDKADQSEYRLHNILVGGVNYDHLFRNKKSSISIYGSGQTTKRNHYTGTDQQDGWGKTKDYTLQGGIQYNYTASNFLGGKNVLTAGVENQYEYTFDEIEAYDYLIDQGVNLAGVFLQSDWEITDKFTLLSGLRLNKSNRVDDLAFTPRLSTLYKLTPEMQLRASYARGFKAPQALETDMHIAFAGGGVSLIRVDEALKQETSDSFNASVDFNRASEDFIYGFTFDGFHTRLHDAFILEDIGEDKNGNMQYLRKNGGQATVKGLTFEARANYMQLVQLESGVTVQNSRFSEAVLWSEEQPSSHKFLRTPDVYGYYTLSFLPQRRFNATLSGVLTGPMEVPHLAGAPGVEDDELKKTSTYFENHLKLSYRFTLKDLKQDLQLSLGVQNMFNQYQNDFDIGKNRDSNYIYGPARPRTFFLGVKFGLM